MSKLTVYHIPVPVHVREFLIKELGPDPWPIHQNQFMGVVVKMKVEKQAFRQLYRPAPVEPDLRRCVRLTLPTALKHYTLSADSSKDIGAMLNKFFLEKMFSFIEGQAILSGNDRAALRSFFKLYELNPEHYDLEMGRKAYRDHKERMQRRNEERLELLYEQPEMLYSDYAKAS